MESLVEDDADVATVVEALPAVEEVEVAADEPGVDVPLGVLPCTAAAKWACIEDDGWNTGILCGIIMSS